MLGSPPRNACAPVSLRSEAIQPVCVPSFLLSFPFLLFAKHLLVPAACWALVVQDEYEKKESCTSWPLCGQFCSVPQRRVRGRGGAIEILVSRICLCRKGTPLTNSKALFLALPPANPYHCLRHRPAVCPALVCRPPEPASSVLYQGGSVLPGGVSEGCCGGVCVAKMPGTSCHLPHLCGLREEGQWLRMC